MCFILGKILLVGENEEIQTEEIQIESIIAVVHKMILNYCLDLGLWKDVLSLSFSSLVLKG